MIDPWVGKIPWRRAWKPTPIFLPGESHGQRSLLGYSHGVAKSQTCLSTSTTTLNRPFPTRRPRRKGGTFLFLLGLPHPSASFATQPTLGIQDLCQRDVFTLLSHQPPPLSVPALGGWRGGGGGASPSPPDLQGTSKHWMSLQVLGFSFPYPLKLGGDRRW